MDQPKRTDNSALSGEPIKEVGSITKELDALDLSQISPGKPNIIAQEKSFDLSKEIDAEL